MSLNSESTNSHETATCERCLETVDSEEIRTVRTGARYSSRITSADWCTSCIDEHAYWCSDCEELWSDRAQWSDEPLLCLDCCDHYRRCYECGYIIHEDNACYSEAREEYFCESCYPSDDDDDEKPDCIRPYSYRPSPIFHGGANRIHYGVELEVSGELSTADDTQSLLGGERHVYLKEDGSIDTGYEIVSHPHTLAAHQELWTERVFRMLRSNGLSADENGMHVHIQRQYLTRMQIQKMQAFFNHEDNLTFIEKIAERNTSQWAQCTAWLGKLTARAGDDDDRYVALNLKNSRTVEVRIFRGTVRYANFHKNLEFCAALVAFTACSLRPYWDNSVQSFCAFVRANRKEYSRLDDFLVAKQYLTAVVKRTDKRSLPTCA